MCNAIAQDIGKEDMHISRIGASDVGFLCGRKLRLCMGWSKMDWGQLTVQEITNQRPIVRALEIVKISGRHIS